MSPATTDQQELSNSRPASLVIYHSPLFAAHWSLWIPSENDSDLGKIIHVHGSVAEGFEHEFKRNYRLSEDSRTNSIRLLGTVSGSSIVDPEDETYYTDVIPLDIMEETALRVEAPGPSLRQSQTHVSSPGA